MKIQVDGKQVFELNSTQEKVICNDIPEDIFRKDMERRAKWVFEHKYERCFERLKKEWEPKLSTKMDSIPTDKDKFALLVFSQPDYKSRFAIEEEIKKQEHLSRTGQN